MNTTYLNKPQLDYAIAKATYEAACEAESEAEKSFLLRNGITRKDGKAVASTMELLDLTDDEFDAVNARLCEDEAFKSAFDAKNNALDAKIRAEDALIDYALTLAPPRAREVLDAHRRDYTTRKKLIEVAFRLDTTTVPKAV